ncbi:MAG: L-threonylcarbamoyladenylate synthase [Chloroflexota bacterium]
MKTFVLPASSAESIDRAVEVLRGGGLVAFPTDTVYGLGALAFNSAAVKRIYVAKDRPPDKAIPVLLSSVEEIDLVAVSVGDRALRLARRYWPGPLTLVVPKSDRVPEAVAAATVGIRVPDHPVALALLGVSGPLAVSSANLSGNDSPVTAAEALRQLDGRVEIILDGGTTPGGIPSTVADCNGDELVILRPGPLTLQELQAALG